MRSPMTQTYLSIKTDYDKLDSYTDETAEEELEIAKQNLARVQAIDPSALDNQTRLSLKLMTEQLEQEIGDYQWRYHNYTVNQMFGLHSGLPSFMINQHLIRSAQDAKDYISRLNEFPRVFAELEANLYKRA